MRVTVPNNLALADKTFTGRWYVTDGGGVGGVAVCKPFHFKVFRSLKSGHRLRGQFRDRQHHALVADPPVVR